METSVSELLSHKGAAVFSLPPSASVRDAVDEMCARRIGAVLVCEDAHPLGIFSERDLMVRVLLRRLDPAATRLDEVMTRELVAVHEDTRVSEAMAVMTRQRCRHLPVIAEGRVVGVVSIGDLVRSVSQNQEYEIRLMVDYITGRYPG